MSDILCTVPVLLTIYRGGPNVGASGSAGLHCALRHEVVQEKKNVSVPARGAGVHAQRVVPAFVQQCMLREFVHAVVQECMPREFVPAVVQGYPVRFFCGADVYSVFYCASEFCICSGVGVNSELVPAV